MPRRFQGPNSNNINRSRRGRKKYYATRNNTSSGASASDAIIQQPRFKPVTYFNRTVTALFDINADGINPSLVSNVFTLSQLPNFTDYTNLFQSYRLNKIKIAWEPEYTELTDAALVSNAINVQFNSVVDQTDPAAPATVDVVTQYQNCKSTGITKRHSRTFQPAMLTTSSMPCHCYLSTTNPGERHYGVKVGIKPTGVAMVFRSTATFYFECAGSR